MAVAQVVLLLADGVRPDVLQRLHEAGRVPALSAHLIGPQGGSVRVAASVLPSTTGPAHLPFLTGRFPGPCNVPGIRWLDPHEYRARALSRDRFRSYMGLGSRRYATDLAPGIRTVYELVPDHACAGSSLTRGVARGRNLTRWAKPLGSLRGFLAEDWSYVDRLTSQRVARAVAEGRRFVFGALYAVDASGHRLGPEHERTLEAHGLVDALVARLFESRRGHEAPLVMIVSDHGQSATQFHLDLAAVVERAWGCCLAHPLLHRGLWRARSAVMVSGNGMAHVYRLRAGAEPNALDSGLAETLLAQEAVDHVIGRRPDGTVVVRSSGGRAEIARAGERISYAVTEGADPFGYGPELVGRHDDRELLGRTWETEYPDAPAQVLQIFESRRCGDLVVTARPGFDLRARFEKPRHAGTHGGLHRLHVRTPLLASHPLRPGPARTVDVLPTLLDALGVAVPAGLDGRSLWPQAQGSPAR